MERAGGRFVWSDAEVALCDVSVWETPAGPAQVGIVSPTTEGCPGMLEAFAVHGVPDTACLFIRFGDTEDEFCAPLTVE